MPIAPKQHRPRHYTPPAVRRQECDRRRGTAHQRGYTSKWRKETLQYINEQMAAGECRCAMCGKLLTGDRKDIHVDHKIPHKGPDDPMFWKRSNWQMLHRACHSAKTVKDTAAGLTRTG